MQVNLPKYKKMINTTHTISIYLVLSYRKHGSRSLLIWFLSDFHSTNSDIHSWSTIFIVVIIVRGIEVNRGYTASSFYPFNPTPDIFIFFLPSFSFPFYPSSLPFFPPLHSLFTPLPSLLPSYSFPFLSHSFLPILAH